LLWAAPLSDPPRAILVIGWQESAGAIRPARQVVILAVAINRHFGCL
jgi:hypothetical protein